MHLQIKTQHGVQQHALPPRPRARPQDGIAQRPKADGRLPNERTGAGDESRTRDLNLGKVALYQLSYSRRGTADYSGANGAVIAGPGPPALFRPHPMPTGAARPGAGTGASNR